MTMGGNAQPWKGTDASIRRSDGDGVDGVGSNGACSASCEADLVRTQQIPPVSHKQPNTDILR